MNDATQVDLDVFTPPSGANDLSDMILPGITCEPFAIISESSGARDMTFVSASLKNGSVAVLSIILGAVRDWREARDTGLAVQPHLFAKLAREGAGILAPVLDSLMQLYEAALRRPLRTGFGQALSDDENVLLDLLSGTRSRQDCFEGSSDLVPAFDTALISTRIMVRMALALPADF